MNLEGVLMALALVLIIFLVAYGLLIIHMNGFHLGRHSAWEAFTLQKPTDPFGSAPKFHEKKVPGPHDPPVYSARETMEPMPEGPMSEVPIHEETPLPPLNI